MRSILLLFAVCMTNAFSDNISIPARDPFIAALNANNTRTDLKTAGLKSCWIPLYFAKANDVASFIAKPDLQMLSPQGKIHADKNTNQLWLMDDEKHIAIIRTLIHHLDQSGPQFLIKAKIINLDRQYQKSLGVLFQTNPATTNPIAPLTMNEPDTNTGAGEFTIGLAKLPGNNLLNLQLSALEQEGHATLISNPALVTLNKLPAVIQSGAEVPYQEATSSGATSVSFKKAVLQLKVTPQAMPHHRILLHIALNQDKVSALTVNGVPAIQTQQIATQVIVNNNQTLVLGGILETSRAKQNTGIPVVDDIPVLGHLLRHHTKQIKQQELLIFITPARMK